MTGVGAQLVSEAIELSSRAISGKLSAARPCSSLAMATSARRPAGGPAKYFLAGQPAMAALKSATAARNPSEAPFMVAANSSQYPFRYSYKYRSSTRTAAAAAALDCTHAMVSVRLG